MSRPLVVRIELGRVLAECAGRKGAAWRAEATYADPADLTRTLSTLLRGAPARPRVRRLLALVAPPLVQLRTLGGLPPVRTPALRGLVQHQAGRFFRKNGVPLVTNATWIREGQGAHRVRARAAAVEEPLVEAIAAGSREAGLTLVDVRALPEAAGVPLSLVPASLARARRRSSARGITRLGVAVVLLWLGLASAWVAKTRQERRAITVELQSLREPAAAVLAVRRKVGETRGMLAVLAADDAARGAPAQLLARLAATLPDSAFLTTVAVDSLGHGSLAGYARRASAVVALLERSGMVGQPTLRGEVVREPIAGRDWERFTLEFEVPTP